MNAANPALARFELAKTAARSAGELALDYFRHPERIRIEEKVNAQDMVSQADREVETLIREAIGAQFPDDRIIGEEFGMDDREAEYTWVIDPIDGTSPFVHGIPAWCVSIALIAGGRYVAGVIFAPCANELYAAFEGAGATLNDRPLRLSESDTVANGLVGVGGSHRVPPEELSRFVHTLVQSGGMFIRNGSGALMLAYVAAGRLVAYYEPHINAWDCLAGICLIREAGGWTNDFLGEFDLATGGPVITAGPGAREQLLALIEKSATVKIEGPS